MLVVYFNSDTAKMSVRQLVGGQHAIAFWMGIVVLGIAVPMGISLVSLFTGTEASSMILILGIVCHTAGAFALKYCLLKGGIHQPIITKARYA
jgi:formate-dependent nitrite reductase membrane component NrfD